MKLFICSLSLLLAGCLYEGSETKVGRAKRDMVDIHQALEKYYVENQDWPTQLEDIAYLLEAGENGLIDPWGQDYKFAIVETKVEDGTTFQRAVVWTKCMVDGKIQVFTCPSDVKLTDEIKDEATKEAIAKNDARVIEQACKKYYLENAKWPAKLADIADLLENGKKALNDPWGKEYKFAIVTKKGEDGTEIQRPYIWTERTVDGKIKVYGMKPPEEKK
jgi:type II secretory pathway pseudopilin PulG